MLLHTHTDQSTHATRVLIPRTCTCTTHRRHAHTTPTHKEGLLFLSHLRALPVAWPWPLSASLCPRKEVTAFPTEAAVLCVDGSRQACVCRRVHWEDLLQLSRLGAPDGSAAVGSSPAHQLGLSTLCEPAPPSRSSVVRVYSLCVFGIYHSFIMYQCSNTCHQLSACVCRLLLGLDSLGRTRSPWCSHCTRSPRPGVAVCFRASVLPSSRLLGLCPSPEISRVRGPGSFVGEWLWRCSQDVCL